MFGSHRKGSGVVEGGIRLTKKPEDAEEAGARRKSVMGGKNPLKAFARLSQKFKPSQEEKDRELESKRLGSTYQGLDGTSTTTLYCWGDNHFGQLFTGKEDVSVVSRFEVQKVGKFEARCIVDVASSSSHALALTNDGQVYGSGSNEDGQIHSSRAKDAFMRGPILIDEPILQNKRIIQVACGEAHSAFLTVDGFVITYGRNDYGQLGHSSDRQQHKVAPRIVQGLGRESGIQIACSLNATFILSSRGILFSFGENKYGVLGLGDIENRRDPKIVQGALFGNPVVQIAAGAYHCCAVTITGRVYAWGHNISGQLGTSNEFELSMLPELVKVHEPVRSVACGRDHSVYVTVHGHVYTCGKNMYGVLGMKKMKSDGVVDTPYEIESVMELGQDKGYGGIVQAICGDTSTTLLFESGHVVELGSALGPDDDGYNEDGKPVVVPLDDDLKIFRLAGNGQSIFAISTKTSVDARRKSTAIRRTGHQIQTMTGASLGERANLVLKASNSSNKRKSARSLKRQLNLQLFNMYTFNSSFLKKEADVGRTNLPITVGKNDMHSFKDENLGSGLDVEPLIRGLNQLYEAFQTALGEKDASMYLRSKIAPLVSELDDLAPNATEPDQLRVYMIFFMLPFAHAVPREHELLILAMKRLPKHSRKMIFQWIERDVPSDILQENLLKPTLKLLDRKLLYHRFDDSCEFFCKVLKGLKRVSDSRKRSTRYGFSMIPNMEFYSEQLAQFTDEDIARMFERWRKQLAARKEVAEAAKFGKKVSDPATIQMAGLFTVFDYDFILSADVKRKVLQMEDQASMYRNLLFSQLFMNSPYFVLEVRRDHLLADTIAKISKIDPQELKKPLRVKFEGEEGLDAGGVKKEFFQLLSAQLFNPDFGMFKVYPGTNTMWFHTVHEDIKQDQTEFVLVGALIGLAIYNSTLLDVQFPLVMYRMLLGKMPPEPDLDILAELDAEYAKNLRYMLEYDGEDFEDVFSQNFEVMVNVYGENKPVPLKENGSNIPVTLENREEYIKLLVKYVVVDSVQPLASSLVRGFQMVIPDNLASLTLFEPVELEQVTTGSPDLDFDDLQALCTYEGGYTADHPTVVKFWKILKGWDEDKKRKFLKFATGSNKAPVGGLKTITFKIQRAGPDSQQLPTAHTCFNTVMLPDYPTDEKMQRLLETAIENCEGFGLE